MKNHYIIVNVDFFFILSAIARKCKTMTIEWELSGILCSFRLHQILENYPLYLFMYLFS